MSESKQEKNVESSGDLQFLKDKVFLIIGAETQLGLDLGQVSAELGSQVILAGMNEPLLKDAAKRLVSQDYKAFFSCLNPTQPEEVKNTFKSLKSKFEKIDYLILNMDFRNQKKIVETSWIDWQNHLLINLTAPFLFIKYAFSYMKKGSKIVLINSQRTQITDKKSAAFRTAKAALKEFMNVAREESAEYGIELIEANVDESTATSKGNLKNFYFDSAKRIVLALNPFSEVHQKEIHLGQH